MPLNNPGPTMEDLILREQWGEVSTNSGWTSTLAGTGSVTQGPRILRVDSGATSGGTAKVATTAIVGWSMGQNRVLLNFSKRLVLRFVITATGAGADGVSRVLLGGKLVSAALGDPASRGIGIRINNLALSGLVHNGTTLTVVDLSTTLTSITTAIVDIVSDGNGRVEWFVNRVSKGSSTAGPTGLSSSSEAGLICEAANVTHNANQLLDISNIKFLVVQ